MSLYYIEMVSPVGKLKLVAEDKALVAILWKNESFNRIKLPAMIKDPRHPILIKTEEQLKEYFSGERTQFDIPLKPRGTAFQLKVWTALRKIPFGVTKTYKDLAIMLGSAKSSRAVGAANGRNPISIIIPCHRVIGSNGKLTGFAGGLEAKEALLAKENRLDHLLSTGLNIL